MAPDTGDSKSRLRLHAALCLSVCVFEHVSLSTVASPFFLSVPKRIMTEVETYLAVPERGLDESRCRRLQLPTRRVEFPGSYWLYEDELNFIWFSRK